MRLSLTSSTLLVLVLLNLVSSQAVSSAASDVSQVETTTVQPTTTTDTPVTTTTTNEPTPTTTTPNPTTTTDPATTDSPTTTTDPTDDPTTTRRSTTTTRSSRSSQPTENNSTTDIYPTPSSTNTPSPTPEHAQNSNNKTAIIAGSVVGGLVGVAVIAGVLTWLNRHGGCASRTRRRGDRTEINDNFENQDSMKMEQTTAPASPFQHARRFVPPNTGYMNLTDEEYGYNSSYAAPAEHYNTSYPTQYHNTTPSYQNYEYQTSNYPPTTPSELTSPTVVAHHSGSLKPDQIEQKPNAA
ncbi:hypothetical protein G6F29_010601 [Rhizopus arrhizus]|nr:hypothetical protein G6F18_010288 [Rhizopus arrhizus]KAG0865378.1 hypothetical protein G6F16_010282 [Rhizopus arrhizus]KAG0875331.1 hypothetical protein G6F15_010379 [Rhizopus arrhizus]KAG0909953.1 hypothetical protein G6F33_008324 [Rhizopus arrhizus]KAG0937561.1 hypothetical protein G6F32_009720 [Rhizopus arrhizus]